MNAKAEILVRADKLAHESCFRVPTRASVPGGATSAARTAGRAPPPDRADWRRCAGRCCLEVQSQGDYRFATEDGPSDLAGLFSDKQTLAVYNPHVRSGEEATVPHVHEPARRLGRQCRRHRSAGVYRGCRALADGAPRGSKARTGLEEPEATKCSQRRFHARLCGKSGDGLDSGGPAVLTLRDGAGRHFWSQESQATPARIRAARPTRLHCGPCSI